MFRVPAETLRPQVEVQLSISSTRLGLVAAIECCESMLLRRIQPVVASGSASDQSGQSGCAGCVDGWWREPFCQSLHQFKGFYSVVLL